MPVIMVWRCRFFHEPTFTSIEQKSHESGHLITPHTEKCFVAAMLFIQAGLIGYSATKHSPTDLEPAFLAAGICHWQLGRYELYRVNPPLVRMVAALPAMAVGCKTDWSQFYENPGARAEFPIGAAFIKANGPNSIPLFFYARWACIPFNLIGAYFAYRWAKELYGGHAGLLTLTLFVFEPNLLAHGELIVPDGASTAFGILAGYTFWRWLKRPSWSTTVLAGGALALAELSKMSWLILFGLWPLLLLIWRYLDRRHVDGARVLSSSKTRDTPPLIQLATILALALYLMNLGYAFDGTFTKLKDFQFVSKPFTGQNEPGIPGNRFRQAWFGELPVPIPKQYLLGLDAQMKDFERFHVKSYLRGEVKQGGWWYYYIYGLLVKIPCGTWALFVLVTLDRLLARCRPVPLRDEIVLLLPAFILLALVSSQTEFNVHLRYVFPCVGIALIFLGQAFCRLTVRFSLGSVCTIAFLGYSILSCLFVYPHHLAFFNDFVGGPRNGYKHLLGSSLDWGQDLLYVKEYAQKKTKVIVEIEGCVASRELIEVVLPHKDDKPQRLERRVLVSPNILFVDSKFIFPSKSLTPSIWGADWDDSN